MSTTTTVEFSELRQAESTFTPTRILSRSKGSLEISRSPRDISSNNHTGPSTENNGDDELESFQLASASTPILPSKLRIALTIGQPSLVNFFSSFTTGIITVALPVIAQSLSLPQSLYLWPSSVYGLTAGAMLLIAGSIADLIGPRRVELVGIFLLGIFTLAGGVCTTGIQLVVFRALQGVAWAMHLPASVAIVAAGVPEGRARNFGFACLGLSQPLGFSVGLVASGILVDRVGWRMPFYLAGGGLLLSAVAAIWMVPKVDPKREGASKIGIWKRLYTQVDWVGGTLASGGLAMFAYVLAILSADLKAFDSYITVTLFTISIVLMIAFPFWMNYREKLGKPALVPNSLWKNLAFTATCIMVALSNGFISSMELFSSLYFQEVQKKSTLTTSLYLIPSLLVGVAVNACIGVFVHRVQARWLVAIACLLCSIAPLMMAMVNPTWNYWYLEFWSQALSPLSVDILFTVGLIIVSNNFPEKMQGLAGAVFNTVAQFGQSFGVGLCQVVALGVMGTGNGENGHSGIGHGTASEGVNDATVLEGYRASFWTMFASMILCGLTAVVGLRKAGKVGLKKD